jgi:MFS family permease
LYLGTLTFVLYLDRVCIGKAVPSIERDLQISHSSMSWILGAFTIAYGLFEVPTGRWGDRFGSRRIMTRIVLWWSAFTVLTGCVPRFSYRFSWNVTGWLGRGQTSDDVFIPVAFNSFWLLLIIRFLFGAGEAGALPNTARIVARWYPVAERGVAQAVVLTSMLVGGAASPILAGYLIEEVGWRWTFALFGSLGVVWAGCFYYWFRDDPAEHRGVNLEERQLIARGAQLPVGQQSHIALSWGQVAKSLNVWLLGGIMSCSAFAAYLYTSWYPTYLEEARGVAPKMAGWLSGQVLAGGAVGALLGSYLSMHLDRWNWNPRWKRPLLSFALLAAAAACILASVSCQSAYVGTNWLSLAFLLAQAQQANWWSVTADISGRHLGAMFGLMNSMGVPGAFGSQRFMGWFADMRKAQGFAGRECWDPAFILYVAVLFLGALMWLAVDSRRPIFNNSAEGVA